MSPILVIVEMQRGGIRAASREAFTVAEAIAQAEGKSWGTLTLGQRDTGRIDTSQGVQETDTALSALNPAVCASAVAKAAVGAEYLLMTHTALGADLVGRVAQHLNVPLASDCVDFEIRGTDIVFTRSLYGGKVLCDIRVNATPVLATFRPRAVAPPAEGQMLGLQELLDIPEAETGMQVESVPAAVRERLDVTEAAIVVSGGRGMQGPKNWRILEELANALGPRATLACSRPVSDDGWRPRSEHVGQTGRAIAPDLYVAVGISGAIQHVAGIARSKFILAINKDPNAPIFKVADYGIVGNLFEVVPSLTKAIRALKNRNE